MDILNKVTGQLMAGIEDVKGFFAEVEEDVQHEWQCLTSDGEPVAEPTEDGIVPGTPDLTKYPTIDPQPDMGVSGVPSVQNPLGQEFGESVVMTPEYFANQDQKNAQMRAILDAMPIATPEAGAL